MRLGIWCAIRSRAVGGLAPISARGGAARTLTQSSVRRGPLRSRDPSRADTNWARIEPLSVTTTSRRAASGVSRGDADTDTPAPDAKLVGNRLAQGPRKKDPLPLPVRAPVALS